MRAILQQAIHEVFRKHRLSPPQILVIGFGVLILFGGVLLSMPFSSARGVSTDYLTSVFTATSAVCVTGLVVVDTANHWSPIGQAIILSLIQIGGLGFMTMTTMIFLLAGKRITIRERLIIRDSLSSNTLEGIVRFVRYILLFTFVVEGLGALLLSLVFIPEHGWSKGVGMSIFHSVSAFCNAGFDIVGGFKSLTPYVNDPIVNLVISLLIIVGGLGFSVVHNLVEQRKWKKLHLHTKVVLTVTGFLLVGGTALFFLLESNNTMKGLPPLGVGLSSFFMSVTPRTAGFNTLDIASLTTGSIFLTILLMFIGGSPGSTAGGVKTTTIGVLIFTLISVLKGRKESEAFGRTINMDIVRRALSITMIGILLLIVDVLVLSVTESATLTELIFEAVSAFGTVGLSMGITTDLTGIGRVFIMLTMFVGRVGPMTIAFAISEMQASKESGQYRYPEGNVIV